MLFYIAQDILLKTRAVQMIRWEIVRFIVILVNA